MSTHILVLGAGFGGLELSSRLSEAAPDRVRVTLIDKNDGFVFGFSKFEVMFGRQSVDQVKARYRDIVKPGVEFRQETITAIDPAAKRVTTSGGSYDADILVVALGADYNVGATPGLAEGGYEFYSVAVAARLSTVLPAFEGGPVVVGVVGEPFKCPPAPCEAAMLLAEYLEGRGLAPSSPITVVSPWGMPIPATKPGSDAILARFAEKGITFLSNDGIASIDPGRKVALLKSGGELPYALFLAVPRHEVPAVVARSGMAENGWIPVERANLATRFPGVYAVGDVTSAPVPKAGIFSESAARAVAGDILHKLGLGPEPAPYDGAGSCFIEFGEHRVGRVDVDFLTGPSVVAPFREPSEQGAAEKAEFAASHRQRWFGYES